MEEGIFSRSFTILYEDNHLLVMNKEPGVLVQGDKTGDVPLVELAKQYIKKKYQKPGEVFLGVVHRLDRPVSGIVVMARTSKALARMNALFRERETEKTYYAWVDGQPPNDNQRLIHWLKKDESKNKTTAYAEETKGSLRAELTYTVIARNDQRWLVRVLPVTGRPHQIRVQLAAAGFPISGDLKYGSATPPVKGSIYLHARRLSFVHPTKKEKVTFVAPFPSFGLWKHAIDEL